MNEITVGDLFSGIGLFSLAHRWVGGFRTVFYCEIEAYCQQVLQARMLDGTLDTAPICTDVTKLDGKPWAGRVDVLCGGFPCQDLSFAGAGAGIDGERSGLWREMVRLVREIRPRILFVENVPALLSRGLGRVLGDLAASGYDAEWDCIPAGALGAPHLRDRIWIVAYPSSAWERRKPREGQDEGNASVLADTDGRRQGADSKVLHEGQPESGGGRQDVAHAKRRGLQGGILEFPRSAAIVAPKDRWDRAGIAYGQAWDPEPLVDRVADGVPFQMERLRACGNAIVPQVAERVWRRIMKDLS